eukprot:1147992-Pelagomonas_calceolata.AAC.9
MSGIVFPTLLKRCLMKCGLITFPSPCTHLCQQVCRLHVRGGAAGQAAVPWQKCGAPVGTHHRPAGHSPP